MKQWAQQKQTGFTIVELLIVVVVIAILAAITIVAYNGIQQRSRASALQSELSQSARALEARKLQDGTQQYPASLSDIDVTSDTLTYYYNARSNSFCIDGKDGDAEYSVTSRNLTPFERPCVERSLALWLPFNGNTIDVSGNDHVFNVAGGPLTTSGATGVAGTALAFDGSDDIMTINSDAIPSQVDHFTVSMWVRGVGSPSNDYGTYFHRSNGAAIGSSIVWIGGNTSQNITTAANGQYGTGTTGVIADNTWRHVVLVYAGGYQTGYINGVQHRDQQVGPMTNTSTSNRVSIGASYTVGYRDINGAIDDLRVYERPLTAAEVADLYNRGAQ